jgi:hypothetical protein
VERLDSGKLTDVARYAPGLEPARGVQVALRVWLLLICVVKNST